MPIKKPKPRADTPQPAGARERILDAALAVLRTGGVRQFTQTAVAERAGLRQSHLTYYFPTRPELLEATVMTFVNSIACGIGRTITAEAKTPHDVLPELAKAIAQHEHMRMFIGVLVEADDDPVLRGIVGRGTKRMEAALAEALGGPDAATRARVALATLWGLGLYSFAMRPKGSDDPTPAALAWLEGAARYGKPTRRRP